jgi:hypothetical protein
MEELPEPIEPANLRFLRRLVTFLTGTMIVGLVVILALVVIRLSDDSPILPEDITLPDGAEAQSVTMGEGWYAIVTKDQRILIFNALTGALQQTVDIK